MKPEIAISKYKLGLLSSEEIVQLADLWLTQGIFTDSLNFLAMELYPVMATVGPMFEKAIIELGLTVPSKIEAAKYLARDTIEKMVSGEIDLMVGANFLYWDVHHEITDELPDGKYLGSNLGFEHIFCWLREVWDCRDGSRILYYTDLPRDEAEVKFLIHLKEEAEAWLANQA
ncbi:hypothetical protein ACPFUN_003587 [Vibrio cholerae]